MSEIYQEQWESFSSSERESFARRLAVQLPTGFGFLSLATHRLGSQEHQVATFNGSGTTFVLIPGGLFRVGYDADRLWQPHADELESWNETADKCGIEVTIHEYIASSTLRRRSVEFQPFLMEVSAAEVGWQPVSLDDSSVRDIIENCFAEWSTKFTRSEARSNITTRVRRAADGSVSAWRAKNPTHASLSQELARSGFRFPTSDEWEYACGAGTETLFRWGDHVPCDRTPYDQTSDWNEHRLPNAFGLMIAQDTYKFEVVAEADITRGGDGGVAECGGYGCFVSWLPLASAYFETHTCQRDPTETIAIGYTIGRRVLSLA